MKKILVFTMLLFLLTSCFWDKKEEVKNNENNKTENSLETNETFLDSLLKDKYLSKTQFDDLNKYLNNGEFNKSNKIIDKILKKLENKTTEKDKKIKVRLLEIKIGNLLNNGTYSYSEKIGTIKAKRIINKLVEEDPNLGSTFFIQYNLGYSEEILKNYTKALEYYSNALNYLAKDSKNDIFFGQIYNQIGHVYDLKGDTKNAINYYEKAYKKDSNSEIILMNLARKYTQKGEYEKSKNFFNKALKTKNKVLKSEIYFSLSSIELAMNGYTPDINKAIEYAKKSIENFSKYPMGYYALAKAYYMLNDKSKLNLIEENIEKSLKLNSKGYATYELLGLLWWDYKNEEETLKNLTKAYNLIDKDMILMDNERKYLKEKIYASILMIQKINKDGEEKTKEFLEKNLDYQAYIENIILQLKRKNNGYLGTIGENFKEELKIK